MQTNYEDDADDQIEDISSWISTGYYPGVPWSHSQDTAISIPHESPPMNI